MAGVLVLTGGQDFALLNAPRSAAIMDIAPPGPVAILAAAAAYEGLASVQSEAVAWCQANNREAIVLPVVQHHDVTDDVVADVNRAAVVLVCDGSPLHLRSVLKGSALVDALHGALARGAVVIASGSAATVFGDPMVDPRGGAYTVGLAFAPGLAILPSRHDTSMHLLERARALQPQGAVLVGIAEGAALVRTAGDWQALGDGKITVFGAGSERQSTPGDHIEM